MRVRSKILLLCIALCGIAIIVPGVLLIVMNFRQAEDFELRSLRRESLQIRNTFTNMYWAEQHLGMMESSSGNDAGAAIQTARTVAQEYFSGLAASELLVDFYSSDGGKFYTNHNLFQGDRSEISAWKKGTWSQVIRNSEGRRYFVVTDGIEAGRQLFIFSVSRDVSRVDESLEAQLLLFSGIFIAAMAVLAVIVPFLSSQITQPIEELVNTSAEISAGLFHRRVIPRGKDEVGKLAAGFNTMAAEVEKTIGLLNSQAEQKQRFIDNLTHELMNPLTTIIGYADFLMKKKKYEPLVFNKSLGYIYSEGKRIVELSDRLFDLMLLKNRKLALEKEPVLPLLSEIRETLAIKMRQKDIALSVEGRDVMLPMERSLLKAAVVNLVDNAWKASPRGSRIIIGTGIKRTKERKAVTIYVKDTGRGIPAGEMEKILEPFYQVQKAVSQGPAEKGEGKSGSGEFAAKGAGLGLSITAEILKLHGARLVYESEEGKGTIAKIVF